MSEKPAIYHPFWDSHKQLDDWDWFYISPQSSTSFENYNPIIILGGTLFWLERYESETRMIAEAVKREREVFNILEGGGHNMYSFWNR